ncbi:MAG: hypothetical protein R3283_01210 [Balneolaceae bacterium]|nr:hypothetical protein [Balneolaceae bacterium]
MISESLERQSVINIYEIDQLDEVPNAEKIDLCLLDLMSTHHRPKAVISVIKSCFPNSKVIALHIYTLPELIRPIIEEGVDGYLTYDPSRTELIQAIQEVLSGGTYLPLDPK